MFFSSVSQHQQHGVVYVGVINSLVAITLAQILLVKLSYLSHIHCTHVDRHDNNA
jgi:hypothetical protein